LWLGGLLPALGVSRMTLRSRTRLLLLWLRALWSWIAKARHFWFAVLIVIAAILFVLRKGITEPQIRITGLILQVLGICTVVWGIQETRALFGHPGILTLSRDWLRRVPVFGKRDITASVKFKIPALQMRARGYISANSAPDAPVEARVEALEKNVKYINERIDKTQTEMNQKLSAQTKAIEQEQQTRAKEDQDIRAKLEVTETGGLHISAMGALWLFVGIILSTASPELATWLK